jgi:hypothetical protein
MDDTVLIVRRADDVLLVGPYRDLDAALTDVPNVAGEYPGATIQAAPLVAPRAALLV